MPALKQIIINRSEYIILTAMLMALNGSIWLELRSPLHSLLLIHLGLFLIWQPVQRGKRDIPWYNALIFIGITLAFAYWINWWLMAIWLILLIGIVGGSVFANRVERYAYFLVIIFLILELLINVVPQVFDTVKLEYNHGTTDLLFMLIPLILPFLPYTEKKGSSIYVNPLHAITASLLVSLLVIGCLFIMHNTRYDYFTSLIIALLSIGVCLILISWLLAPHTGFSGLSEQWSRSLMNVGSPMEEWLIDLSRIKEEQQSSTDFLNAAVEKLAALPWLQGVEWLTPAGVNLHGVKTKYENKLAIKGQPVILYTRIEIGGALLLQCNLLVQLIEYFYEAKINERELAKQAHLQVIYETGARITHDIKNLLQSMHSMVTILEADTSETISKPVLILKKQFPYFIQRLEQAMNKLQAPQDFARDELFLKDWWRELQVHYRDYSIRFMAEIDENPLIPFDLFDSVAGNLLENAINKRKNEPGISINASVTVSRGCISLRVCDTGTAIDGTIVKDLLREPLKSDNGLGIGLLQAAKQAENLGYSLILKENQNGNVCFELKKS